MPQLSDKELEEHDEEIRHEERKRLLNLLCNGKLLRRHPEDAGEEAYARALQSAIEQWLRMPLFDKAQPAYCVAEAVHAVVGASGSEEPEHHVPPLLSGHMPEWSTFRFSKQAWTLAGSALLLPTCDNILKIEYAAVSEWVRLKVALAESTDQVLKRLDINDELTLYCDPGDEAPQSVLDEFASLFAGQWRADRETPHTALFPCRGWPAIKRSPAQVVSGVDLLTTLSHPFVERFIRVPIKPLLEQAGQNEEILIDVKMPGGEPAKLEGRLKVNCILLWDYIYRLYDGRMEEDREFPFDLKGNDGRTPARGMPLVLTCQDKRTGHGYFEQRWTPQADPSRLFSLQGKPTEEQDGLEAFALSFTSNLQIAPEHLRVECLVPAPRTQTSIEGLGYSENTGVALQACSNIKSESHQGELYLALGPATFPTPSLVTRNDLIRAVCRYMPKPLRDALPDEDCGANIQIFNTVESVELGTLHALYGDKILAVTVVVLSIDAQNFDESLDYYASWLERFLEPYCVVGTNLKVRLRKSDRACI